MNYKKEKIAPYVKMGYIISEFALTQAAQSELNKQGNEQPLRTQGNEQRRRTQREQQRLRTQGIEQPRSTQGETEKLSKELTIGVRKI